jgi:hypothetical protein
MNRKSEAGIAKHAAPIAQASPIPDEIREFLGRPPLLPCDDARLYYAMLATLADSIRPTDLIAWLLIKDLVDHRVEIARYRRFKAAVVLRASGDQGSQITEDNLVFNLDIWIGEHERIENLLRAAEDRFSAALEELDRHVRGLGRFISERWDTIEGELAATQAPDPASGRPTALKSRRISSDQNVSP